MSLSQAISDVVQAIGLKIKQKQDILVSGTNIKTINGTSIVGSGDIPVLASPSVYIQENQPNIGSGTVLWIQTDQLGNVSLWLIDNT